MSALQLSWVASVTVGNATAKSLLTFLASHNFGKPGFEFKISTLAKQLELTERAVQKAFKLLKDKNFIIQEPRFDKSGRQLSNQTYLNIPQEFVDNFFGEGERGSPLGVNVVRGEGERGSPLYNNNINNNLNKSAPRKKRERNFLPQPKKNFEQDRPKSILWGKGHPSWESNFGNKTKN